MSATPVLFRPAELQAAPRELSEYVHQAEAFVAMFRRLGDFADLEGQFQRWANSKDFCIRDRSAIAREVHRILGNDYLGETVRILDTQPAAQESGQKSLTTSDKDAENP
jgi:hypothetical protein